MSQKSMPTTAVMTVCDLCGKPITEADHDDRYAMWVTGGGTKTKPTSTERTWHQMWRGWSKRMGATREEAERGRDVRLDFHGACLVRALKPQLHDALPTGGES